MVVSSAYSSSAPVGSPRARSVTTADGIRGAPCPVPLGNPFPNAMSQTAGFPNETPSATMMRAVATPMPHAGHLVMMPAILPSNYTCVHGLLRGRRNQQKRHWKLGYNFFHMTASVIPRPSTSSFVGQSWVGVNQGSFNLIRLRVHSVPVNYMGHLKACRHNLPDAAVFGPRLVGHSNRSLGMGKNPVTLTLPSVSPIGVDERIPI